MDHAERRRGRLALHKRFGDAIAILSAIYLLNKAYESVADIRHGSLRVLEMLSESIGERGMVTGQVMDLTRHHKTRKMQQLKTGALISASVRIGAYLGAAKVSQEQALLTYAERVGAAFQLRDDFMDSDSNGDAQREAIRLAGEAARKILRDFECTKAAFALAGMALYAAQRIV
jgi:geranylgeranyl diphosphate synthase type II